MGVPLRRGEQPKKIILIEAQRVGERQYVISRDGRNARLIRERAGEQVPNLNRPGWTLQELATSVANDPLATVAAYDFPFGIPIELLDDPAFAAAVGRERRFGTHHAWVEFLAACTSLDFSKSGPEGRMNLDALAAWRDQRWWVPRATDRQTGGSPPLKHQFQNLFNMTVAGAVFLRILEQADVTTVRFLPGGREPSAAGMGGRCSFETYPGWVAKCIGFRGSYKQCPIPCMDAVLVFLKARGVTLYVDPLVRLFIEQYRTGADDPDGADSFLCLAAAMCFREGLAENATGNAPPARLAEEACVIGPCRH